MRNATLALVLSTCAALPAQFPCNMGSPGAPAVYLTCPCSLPSGGIGMSGMNLNLGTGRIGSTAEFLFAPSPPGEYSVLLLGVPNAVPQPIPPGVVACQNNGAPVATLHLEPVAAHFSPGAAFIHYWLYIPANPSLVGLTIAAQGFVHQAGLGTPPFFPSALVGLTILP